MNDISGTPLAEESHDQPGPILDGRALLNFPETEEDRPLIVRYIEEPRRSGAVMQKLEVRQPHAEGRDWTTLEFPIEGPGYVEFTLAFKARVMPASTFYVMAYFGDDSLEIGRQKIDQHEAIYRFTGNLPFKLIDKPWRLGLTLPGNTWFAFQIWDLNVSWHPPRQARA